MGPVPLEPRREAWRRLACRAIGVMLVSDIHERACDLGLSIPPGPGRHKRIARIAEAGLVFIHIPKAAGMSISQALYGTQVKHLSIRLCRQMARGRLADLPSFAVVRDPVQRFLSAYRYARARGGSSNRVAEPFRARYAGFRSIDDALDHVEGAASAYAVDHIFRPQSWYVTDADGELAVDRLLMMDDIPHLPRLVPGFPDTVIPCLNQSPAIDTSLSARQRNRLLHLYAADVALWEAVVTGQARRRTAPSPQLQAEHRPWALPARLARPTPPR